MSLFDLFFFSHFFRLIKTEQIVYICREIRACLERLDDNKLTQSRTGSRNGSTGEHSNNNERRHGCLAKSPEKCVMSSIFRYEVEHSGLKIHTTIMWYERKYIKRNSAIRVFPSLPPTETRKYGYRVWEREWIDAFCCAHNRKGYTRHTPKIRLLNADENTPA